QAAGHRVGGCQVSWQEELRQLDGALASGQISADDYRTRRERILAAAAGQQAPAGPTSGPVPVQQPPQQPPQQPQPQPSQEQPASPFPPPFKWEAQAPQQPSAEATQYVAPQPQQPEPTQVTGQNQGLSG